MPGYAPTSCVLLLSICSFNKASGGEPSYDSSQSILSELPEPTLGNLIHVRQRIRRIVTKSSGIDWGGIPLAELAFNSGLVEGPDFDGAAAAAYFPAVRRYDGRFYQTLGMEGKRKLFGSPHHVLFLSGLYGIVRPFESIQLYSCPLKVPIVDEWRKTDVLTSVLIAYARQHKLACVLDLTAVAAYRDLIDWDLFSADTGVRVLHAFDAMGMGENALVPFGRLMKEYLLNASEQELAAMASEQRLGSVTFRVLAETPAGLPAELRRLHRAEQETALLQPHSVSQLSEVMQGGNPLSPSDESPSSDDWQFTVGHEFRKAVSQSDRKMQGRVMESVLEICRAPMEIVGDTQKPLTDSWAGQWRYRIGDYRLIYRPDEVRRVVHLLAFGPRNDDAVYQP